MGTSVYISSEKIEVLGYSKAGGDVSVNEYVTAPLPEGTMISGRIIDNTAIIDCLSELKRNYPALFNNVSLAVDGSAILLKRIAVPKLNKKQYYRLVRDELSDGSIELVCDYQPLIEAGEGRALLACAIEKSLVESYMSAFKAADVKLNSLRVGVQSILNYISTSHELRNMTFVLNVVDGFTMLSMIFENGTNVFMSRSRLYGDDNVELSRNILDNLSGLLQFNKSEKFSDITHSYYLGLSAEDMELMTSISPYPDIMLGSVNIFKDARGEEKLGKDAHFVYLNALFNKDGVDFIRSHKMHGRLNKLKKPKKAWPVILAGFVLAAAIPSGYFVYQYIELNKGINDINEYLTSELVMEKSKELEAIINETHYYKDISNQLHSKLNEDEKKTVINSKITDLIIGTLADEINIDRFEYNGSAGTVTVSARGKTEGDAAEYTSELGRSTLIESIHYTGYSYTNNGEYSFSLKITLVAGE